MLSKQLILLLIANYPEVVRQFQNIISMPEFAEYNLVQVSSLAEGVEFQRKETSEVIFIDQGVEDIEKISGMLEQVGATPVVILIGENDIETSQNAAQAGVTHFIIKEQLTTQSLRLMIVFSIESQKLKNESTEQIEELRAGLAKVSKASLDLWTSEDQFRKIISENADGIIILDEGGVVRFVNPAVCVLFGREREYILGEIFGFPIVMGERTEVEFVGKDKKVSTAEMRVVETMWEGEKAYLASLRDITDRKQIAQEKTDLINELQNAIEKIKVLSGLIPICSWCKKMRDDAGYWKEVDEYLEDHSRVDFTHGMCPECFKKQEIEFGIKRD
ncbi:MAG: PAS domain S-box protein [Calditrichaeota bacterium]|jgi:PAS domain-containing protein|nr:PAS domain S-box protein [Calditrichota bacterium]